MGQTESAALYDPDVARVLAALAAQGRKPMQKLSVAEARHAYRTSCRVNGLRPMPMHSVTNLTADCGEAALKIRLYRPKAAPKNDAAALVFFHGGGWVIGDLDTHDPICRYLANASNCCIVAVDYRLAPEHPFPAAAHDCLSAYGWITANAAELGLNPCALGVAGDSAGGTLATLVALETCEAAFARPKLQLLFYPVTDLSVESAGYSRVAKGVPIVADTMRWFRTLYVPRPEDQQNWRASPLQATRLHRLPPALIVTARHDPLCEEGVAYVQRLEAAGTRVSHLHLAGQMHGFLTLGGLMETAPVVLDLAAHMAAMLLRAGAK